jgi:hypothetical protein
MPTIDERLDEIKAALARQNEEWHRARRALAGLGDVSVMVPNEFLEGLDALSRVSATRASGLRG